MKTKLINLLPLASIRRMRQVYLLRLAAVVLVVAAGGVLVHGMLLLPSYLHARADLREGVAERAQHPASGSDPRLDEAARHEERVARLQDLDGSVYASTALEQVLRVPRAGVLLTGLEYRAGADVSDPARVLLSGSAKTREELRAFAESLEETRGIDTVELPISTYAKERDIPFVITVTGRFAP